MCDEPEGTIIYDMTALIGIRSDTNEFWQLYPFPNRSTGCHIDKEGAIHELGQYYFRDMKVREMSHLIQSGASKGTQEGKVYGYNLQDVGFWDSCWLWQKDTVGSNGLYPFQVVSYVSYPNPTCVKCAEEIIPPIIDYPDTIWNLYPRSKAIRDSLGTPSAKEAQKAEDERQAKEWQEQLKRQREKRQQQTK